MTDVIPLLAQARRDLDHERAMRAQAEDRAREALAAAERAEARAVAEGERADWAETQLVNVLAALVVDPTGDLPDGAAEGIAESIRQDLHGGLAYADIPEQARKLKETR